MFTALFLTTLIAAPSQALMPATNAICPVLGGKVTPGKSPKVVVRGQEYLLCCAGCDTKLLKTPELFLEHDGTPKNAKEKKDPATKQGLDKHKH